MSKGELEDHGRSVGIELDRRETKLKLVAQLRDFITLKRIQEQMDKEAEDVAYELEASEPPVFEPTLDLVNDLPHGGPDNDPIIQQSIEVPSIPDIDPEIAEQEHKDKIRMLQNMNEDVVQSEARTIASGIALSAAQAEYDALSVLSAKLRADYEAAK